MTAASRTGTVTPTEATESLLVRGRRARECGEPAEAVRLLEAALEHTHDDAEAHYQLGLALAVLQQWEDAVDHYTLAAHFSPARPEFREACVEALLGMGHPEAALEELDRLPTDDRGRPTAQFLRGVCAKRRGDLAAARAAYGAAAAAMPDRAQYWCQLGYVEYLQGDYAAGRASLERALALAPDDAEAQHNLGLLALESGAAAEALARFERANAARPGNPAILAATGHALRDLGRLDAAIAAYEQALALAPDLGDALLNRAYARLMQGDYARGWDEYERRFEATATGAGGTGAPRWQGEALAGRRLLVYGEQGLGDEIMFASCLPDVLARADGAVTVACDPRLATLFRRAFPRATIVGTPRGGAVPLPATDVEIPLGSVPALYRRRAADFPAVSGYLQADAALTEQWRARLAALVPGPWLALAWRGGSPRTRGLQRSIPLRDCLPLFGLGCAIASVQYGEVAAEADAVQREAGVTLHLFPDAGRDLESTAALLAAIGRVVTVDNTIAHLAGALGLEVRTLLPAAPEWRYPRAGAHPLWYPRTQLFRALPGGGWPPVLAQVCRDLRAPG
ncbi:MAG: tetratricopeptide repeat protein [Burkholderiales bacterium]